MKGSVQKVATIFAEAGYLEESQLAHLIDKSGKSLGQILSSEVSGRTVKELMSYEIPVPFTKSKRDRMQAELRRDLSLTPNDLYAYFRKHPGRAAEVAKLLEEAGLLWPGSAEEIQTGIERSGVDHLNSMFREQKLTTEPLAAFLEGENVISRRNRLELAASLMIHNHILGPETVQAMEAEWDRSAKPLNQILEEKGGVSQGRLIEAIQSGMHLPQVDIASATIEPTAINHFPEDLVHRHLFLPIEITEASMTVAMADPLNTALIDIISVVSGRRVTSLYAPQRQILSRLQGAAPLAASGEVSEPAEEAISASDPSKAARPPSVEEIDDDETLIDNVSTVELVSTIIESAFATRATDIHIEPLVDEIRVRYRIDGRLKAILHVPTAMLLPIVARIKVLSDLNVTERRRPQDGHFSLDLGDDNVDLRVSVLPTHLGEKVVIRVLDEANVLRGLDDLGMPEKEEERVKRVIGRPHGIMLACGPTGSGKTTTLYAALNTINSEDINVITIEDPVEYRIGGVNQIQVDASVDMGFAAGLRAILRQDPDVIMVGEIRDPETARIATRSALTGHLVLSTLHSNSSAGSISTLRHMGLPAFTVANSLIGIISQRLVRLLCLKCRQEFTPPKQLRIDLGLDPNSRRKLWKAVGCDNCIDTGYSGRIGVFEVWEITPAMRDAIQADESERALSTVAKEGSMRSLADNAHDLMFDGTTSPEEVLRVVGLE